MPHSTTARPTPSALFWDLDGTLVDTEPVWLAAAADLLEAAGLSTDVGLDAIHGWAIPAVARLLQKAGLNQSEEAIVTALVKLVCVRMIASGVTFTPRARETLRELRGLGVPMALVTMAYRPVVDLVLAELPAGTFSTVVTAEDCAKPKPWPEPYLEAARRLGVAPHESVAIEDSSTGATSAVRAGMYTVLVSPDRPRSPVGDEYWSELGVAAVQRLLSLPKIAAHLP